MKLFALLVLLPAVLATGGHGHGVGAVGAYVVAPRAYTSGYTSLNYVTQPRLYATSYTPQFAEVGIVPVAPALPALPALPAHGAHGKHGAVAATYIVAPQQTVVAAPYVAPQRTVITAPQKFVEPLGYETEVVQERVFREPISKTVTELPDNVRKVRKVVNQHFPMIHKQVTDHYTIEDTLENNIIHHYYEPEENYLADVVGQKFTSAVKHVDHPGEMYQQTNDFEEMVVDTPSYKTITTEEPYTYTEIVERPTVKSVVTNVPRVEYIASETPAAPALRTSSSRKQIQRSFVPPVYTETAQQLPSYRSSTSIPSYNTNNLQGVDLFPRAVARAVLGNRRL